MSFTVSFTVSASASRSEVVSPWVVEGAGVGVPEEHDATRAREAASRTRECERISSVYLGDVQYDPRRFEMGRE